ncbi:MAG: hypothetical protein WDA03_10710 [Trueperaceae bacterium]
MNLSFETILGIIFFIVFFVLPALSRKKGHQDEEEAPKPPPGSAGDGKAPARPAVPAGQPVRGPQAQPQASTAARPAQPQQARKGGPLSAGSIEEALEEIRARVREAQLQEDSRRGAAAPQAATQPQSAKAQTAPRAGRLVPSDPGGGGLVSGEARRIGQTGTTQPSSALGREGAPAPAAQRGARQPQAGGPSAPLEVRRRGAHRARRGSAEITDEVAPTQRAPDGLPRGAAPAARLSAPVLATDRASLVKGMIWHEILSEPAARRRLRRTRSLHR